MNFWEKVTKPTWKYLDDVVGYAPDGTRTFGSYDHVTNTIELYKGWGLGTKAEELAHAMQRYMAKQEGIYRRGYLEMYDASFEEEAWMVLRMLGLMGK